MNGTEAKLVRKVAGEKITVTFNINNSIPPTFEGEEEPAQGQKADEQEPELTSTPNFVVEVIKDGGKRALVLDCHYPEDEVCGKGGTPGDKAASGANICMSSYRTCLVFGNASLPANPLLRWGKRRRMRVTSSPSGR